MKHFQQIWRVNDADPLGVGYADSPLVGFPFSCRKWTGGRGGEGGISTTYLEESSGSAAGPAPWSGHWTLGNTKKVAITFQGLRHWIQHGGSVFTFLRFLDQNAPAEVAVSLFFAQFQMTMRSFFASSSSSSPSLDFNVSTVGESETSLPARSR
jgi:hypothetical protein